MKRLVIIIFLGVMYINSFAQDTAYVSKDKTTALFFKSAVKIVGTIPSGYDILQKEDGLITIKAAKNDFVPGHLNIQEISTTKVIQVPVEYSYGRAGRRIEIGKNAPPIAIVTKAPAYDYSAIVKVLVTGKRKDVVDHEKTGGVKAWIDKLSLSGNAIFFRLEIRNKSNLPFDVDFIRFYIRDLKTVARMATHEQEIVPVYTSISRKTTIVKNQEIAEVFAFHRFSLADDQALNVELYERNGNRHLFLKIRLRDFDNLKTINPASQQPSTLAAQTIN